MRALVLDRASAPRRALHRAREHRRTRSSRVVLARAADASREDVSTASRGPTRRELARVALLAATTPLWADVLNDLGFFTGADAEAPALPTPGPGEKVAIFSGGCFWSVQKALEHAPGVVSAMTGYVGGFVERPRYFDVAGGRTGHVESVYVVYDESKTSYEALLASYWRIVDATRDDGQFVDSGEQYRPVIWVMDDAQREAAERSKAALERENVFGKPIKVAIADASSLPFYPAESYHQRYYAKNPNRYQFYSMLSGREEYIASVWGDERSAAGRRVVA